MTKDKPKNTAVRIKNVTKAFENGRIQALRGIDLSIEEGEFVAIMGPSGCGKSTLMNIIGALDTPDSGEVMVQSHNLADTHDLSEFRSQMVGFIFQLHNLIPTLSAVENVQVPMLEGKHSRAERYEKARELLQKVGLESRESTPPTKLSGGERQRVAIARALANEPKIIIADEPTGSLDSKSAEQVLKLLQKLHRKDNRTIIMVTHDKHVADAADKIIHMLDGEIV